MLGALKKPREGPKAHGVVSERKDPIRSAWTDIRQDPLHHQS